ncbi:hypothetical protein M9H77_07491 [Catharanthus roseus]|uniref:Uncharacterized protein n=1 Tax=Catharanthus roseus TaxID=4058 RepID=A0ACC0BVD1_CATRO|nr:hypothetical protein M9H77_07491 [Catharanthus roseus]
MTKAEQMNGHRVDKRSSSSGSAASRRLTGKPSSLFLSAHSLSKHTNGHTKVKRRPARDRNTYNAGTEKSSSNAARDKAEQPERVQVELKETERSNEEMVKRRRGRDCPRNEVAKGLK